MEQNRKLTLYLPEEARKHLHTVENKEKCHSASFRNQTAIKNAERLGCFFCGKIWNKSTRDIEEWVDCVEAPDDLDAKSIKELRSEEWTALCPWCGVDAVITDKVGPLTPEFINELSTFWFGK